MKRAVLISEPCGLAESIKASLGQKGVECAWIKKTELADREACERASENIDADYVIYSALGAEKNFPEHIADMSVDEWKSFKDEAFRLPYDVYGTFVEKMSLNKKGRFMLVCPLTGVMPAAQGEVSGAIGAAGVMMMKSAVSELGGRGFVGCAAAVGSISDDEYSSSIKYTENVKHHEAVNVRLNSGEAAELLVSALLDMNDAMTGEIYRIDSGLSCGCMREW